MRLRDDVLGGLFDGGEAHDQGVGIFLKAFFFVAGESFAGSDELAVEGFHRGFGCFRGFIEDTGVAFGDGFVGLGVVFGGDVFKAFYDVVGRGCGKGRGLGRHGQEFHDAACAVSGECER